MNRYWGSNKSIESLVNVLRYDRKQAAG